ncbi:hypothetical protein ACOMHN_049585 [Nucella lapillus]
MLVENGQELEELARQLFAACQSGTWQEVSSLLGHGGRVDWEDVHGLTPFIHACKQNNIGVVGNLLQNPQTRALADINKRTRALDTVLHIACKQGQTAIADLLLQWQADVGIIDAEFRTPLHVAIFNRRVSIAQKLLTCQNVDINAQDGSLLTPLHLACEHNLSGVVQTLLDKGVNVNLRDTNGNGPLHTAVQSSIMQVINLLLQRNPDLNLQDENGQTPLHVACVMDDEDVVRKLISHGADVNKRDKDGDAPLDLAAKKGFSGVVMNLLMAGADIIRQDERTADMSERTRHCAGHILELLFAQGSDISLRSQCLQKVYRKAEHVKVLRMFTRCFTDRLTPKGLFCVVLPCLVRKINRNIC